MCRLHVDAIGNMYYHRLEMLGSSRTIVQVVGRNSRVRQELYRMLLWAQLADRLL